MKIRNGNIAISGSLEATGSSNIPILTGSLFGTASWASSSLTASYALNAGTATTSGSFTGSFSGSMTGSLLGTASWSNNAINSLTASYVNPLNQDVLISGSLNVTGSITASFIGNPGGDIVLIPKSSSINTGSVELQGGLKWKRTSTAVATEIGDLITFGGTLGLIEGGTLTTSSIGGLVAQVGEAVMYTMTTFPYSAHNLVKYSTIGTTDASRQITLPQTSSVYVYYNNSGVLTTASTAPSSRSNIILGKVTTDASSILYIDASQINAHHYSNYLDRLFREALGSIFSSGGITTQGTTSGSLNVTAATYFFSQNRYTTTGASPITMDTFYRSSVTGQSIRTTGVSLVSTSSYDNGSGALISIPTGKYVKHSLYLLNNSLQLTAKETYLMVYGQALYDTIGDAEAGGLPTPPSFFTDAIPIIASLVVTPTSQSIQAIIDERPRLGFVSPSKTGVITAHGDLTGLLNDDHPQYLLVDGTRQMSGDLGLGGNILYNFSSVSGSSITGSLFGTASWATNAVTASGYLPLSGGTLTGNLVINQNLTVLGSASITYLTQSNLNIGTNIITVNSNLPTVRYGGLAVIDSGSIGQRSGSLLFDSTNDQWIFVHQDQAILTSSVFLLGPETYNSLGNEIYLTKYVLPKGTGIEHLIDSSILDDGTKVAISSSTDITGSLRVTNAITSSVFSGSLTGSLFGTASWANNATTASYILTASFATSASNASTASYVTTESIAGFTPYQISSGSVKAIVNIGTQSFAVNSGSRTFMEISSSGNVNFSAVGSTTSSPRNIGIFPWNSGMAARYAFGDPLNSLQTSFGGRLQLQSYWGIEIMGNRQSGDSLAFAAGTATDASLNVYGGRLAAPTLVVTATGSQTADLQQWRNSSNSVLSAITNNGYLILGTSTSTGYVLEVNGITRLANNTTISGSISASGSIHIITGSLSVSSITSSLLGTASWATNALTSSYIATASWANNATTASYVATASWANNAISSSYALSASWAPGGGLSGGTSNYIPLWTGGNTLSSSVIFQNGSYIGINTTAPSYALDVNGSGSFTNGITATGSSQIFSGSLTFASSSIVFAPRTENAQELIFYSGSTNLLTMYKGVSTTPNLQHLYFYSKHYNPSLLVTDYCNIAIGARAIQSASLGRNVAIGAVALNSLGPGQSNVAIGMWAGEYMTTGSYNVMVGQEAGASSTGNYNFFLGTNSGLDLAQNVLRSYNSCIALGTSALRFNSNTPSSTASISYTTAIGNLIETTLSDVVILGGGVTSGTGTQNVIIGRYVNDTGEKLQVEGNVDITRNIKVSGSIISNGSGSLHIVSGSFNAPNITGSLLGTASWATNALTASSADNLTVRGTLTAQTLVVQTITASIEYLSGSTQFGDAVTDTHNFTGSVNITGSLSLLTGSATITSITGSVFGTSSWAVSASWAPGGGLRTKSGGVSGSAFTGNPKKTTVTFTTAYSNDQYSVTITGEDARSWTVESKVAGSFVINSNSNTSPSGITYWQTIAYGETS